MEVIIMIILTMIIHESGHLFTAWFFGVKINTIGYHLLKGPYVSRKIDALLWHEFVITSSGIVFNLIAAAYLWSQGWVYFAQLNFVLAIANVIPVQCSDGARLIRLLRKGVVNG